MTSIEDAIKRLQARETPEWKVTRDRLFSEWQRQKMLLDRVKADELRTRLAFANFAGDPTKSEGSERIPISDGVQVKITKVINYTFTSREDVADALERMKATGPEGIFLANRVVRWTPELCIGEWKKLLPLYRAILDPAINAREGTPSLAIIEPKGTIIP